MNQFVFCDDSPRFHVLDMEAWRVVTNITCFVSRNILPAELALLLRSHIPYLIFMPPESVKHADLDDEEEIAALPGYSVVDHVHRHHSVQHL